MKDNIHERIISQRRLEDKMLNDIITRYRKAWKKMACIKRKNNEYNSHPTQHYI